MTVLTALVLIVVVLALAVALESLLQFGRKSATDRFRFIERADVALRQQAEHHRQIMVEMAANYAQSIAVANDQYRQLADAVVTKQQELLTTIIALAQNPNAANTILGLERLRTLNSTAPRSVQEFIQQASGEAARRDPTMYDEDGDVRVPVGL